MKPALVTVCVLLAVMVVSGCTSSMRATDAQTMIYAKGFFKSCAVMMCDDMKTEINYGTNQTFEGCLGECLGMTRVFAQQYKNGVMGT